MNKITRIANTCNTGDFMVKEEIINFKKLSIETIETIIGAFIMAFGIALFLLPNQLSSGGLSGVATIIYYLLNIPMGTTIIVLNIPLYLFAVYKMGKKFFIKSIIGMLSLSFFIDLLDKLNPLTDDRFLACIYGGIIIGLRNSNYLESR